MGLVNTNTLGMLMKLVAEHVLPVLEGHGPARPVPEVAPTVQLGESLPVSEAVAEIPLSAALSTNDAPLASAPAESPLEKTDTKAGSNEEKKVVRERPTTKQAAGAAKRVAGAKT